MKATQEQESILAATQSEGNVKVVAYAGSGKTTTLCLITKAQPRKRFLYLAFNKAIVADVKTKFPANVEARTFHSLAYSAFGRAIQHKLSTRLTGQHVASTLKIEDQMVEMESGDMRRVGASSIGYYLIQCVAAFCRTREPEPNEAVMPLPDFRGITREQGNAIRREYVGSVKRLWARMRDTNDAMPATHDVYVKLWADSAPVITGYDGILFDEAQDADPTMVAVVDAQSVQTIWVGDSFQTIYSWRGAVNAMQHVKGRTEYLTQSFRFGEAIAERANLLLRFLGAEKPLRGNPARDSRIDDLPHPRAILYRTNASVVNELLESVRDDNAEGLTATGIDSALVKIEAINRLRGGKKASGEFSLFASYADLVEYAESPTGGDVLPFVKIEREYGSAAVLSALRIAKATPMDRAKRIIAVAHQAKGLEWMTVRLGHDFCTPPRQAEILAAKHGGRTPPREPGPEELRLLYVAATRAEYVLDDADVDYGGIEERLGVEADAGQADSGAPKPAPAAVA